MMKIFGSDGFRSRFGEKYMTESFLASFADGFSDFCIEQNRFSVVIGRDTRESGNIIEKILSERMSNNGLNVTLAGVLSTPGLAYITTSNNFSYGIMITASHNPASDNGIKLFSKEGYKLDEKSEKIIEHKINSSVINTKFRKAGKIIISKNLIDDYILHFREKYFDTHLNFRMLIDCSNGSNSYICDKIFSNNSNVDLIFNKPNGKNINFRCGALESENLVKITKKGDYDFGIAFDGDGDRIIFCHRDYGLIETEKMICLFVDSLKKLGHPESNVVCTKISNLALEENLSKMSIGLIETDLGDRLVVNKTLETNSMLGAETSGHFFFKQSTTMDGLLALYHFINIVNSLDVEILSKLNKYKHYSRVTKNIEIQSGFDISHAQKLLNSSLSSEEKLIIRKSMWDPVIRLYYDYKSINRFKIFEEIIDDYK